VSSQGRRGAGTAPNRAAATTESTTRSMSLAGFGPDAVEAATFHGRPAPNSNSTTSIGGAGGSA